MHTKIFILLFSCLSFTTYAWNDNQNSGAASMGMANASLMMKDVYATANNPAGLAYLNDFSAGTFYQSRFLVPGLANKTLTIATPSKLGSFGIMANSFGMKNYAENKFAISYARDFASTIAFGVQLNYLNTVIGDGYGKAGAIAAEAGLQAKITNSLSIGAHLFNPTRTRISNNSNERIPSIYKIGLRYDFSEKFLVCVEGEKNSAIRKGVYKAGLQYNFYKSFYLRTGFSSNPTLSSFGIGMDLKGIAADIAMSYHSVLGVSSGLSLSYTLNSGKNKTKSKKKAAQ